MTYKSNPKGVGPLDKTPFGTPIYLAIVADIGSRAQRRLMDRATRRKRCKRKGAGNDIFPTRSVRNR